MKVVCTKCKIEMQVVEIGVSVAELYQNPPEVYKLWSADKHQCPGCDTSVIAGFADRPSYQAFDEYLDEAVQAAADRNELYFSYERLSDARKKSFSLDKK